MLKSIIQKILIIHRCLITYRLCIKVIPVIILTGTNTSHAGFQHSNNFNTSNSLSHPIQVNIRYYNDFSYTSVQDSPIPAGCFVTFKLSLKPPCFLPIVRCQEHLVLLRPEKTVKAWLSMQKQQGYMRLDMAEYNLNNIHAYITSVVNKPLADMTAKKKYSKAGQITGLFIRHAINVKQYTFKNKKTGQISYVNATPSHQFFMENKKTFRSISQFSDKDTLLSHNGDTLMLLCNGNRHNHCGEPLPYNKLTSVYNMEVSLLHTYYVGRQQILVHNTCWPCSKRYNKIARYKFMHELLLGQGRNIRRGMNLVPTYPGDPLLMENTFQKRQRFYAFFFEELNEKPFHLGYNRPSALRLGKYKKLSHAFLYREIGDQMLFMEYEYYPRAYGPNIIITSVPLDAAKQRNWEFAANPADTFMGLEYDKNHLYTVLKKLFLFNDGRQIKNTPQDSQEFCDYAKEVLTQKR